MGTQVILKLRYNPSLLIKALRHRLNFHLKFTGLYLKSRGRSINGIFSFTRTVRPEFNRGSRGGSPQDCVHKNEYYSIVFKLINCVILLLPPVIFIENK